MTLPPPFLSRLDPALSAQAKKAASAPRPGEKSTLAQRKAQEGVSILDLSEGIFTEMDVDGDGEVTFAELLKLMFKFARPEEIETMLSWVAPEPEPEPEPKAELSKQAKDAINSIFKLYDKDKSGSLSLNELKKALEKTGIDPDEIKSCEQTAPRMRIATHPPLLLLSRPSLPAWRSWQGGVLSSCVPCRAVRLTMHVAHPLSAFCLAPSSLPPSPPLSLEQISRTTTRTGTRRSTRRSSWR